MRFISTKIAKFRSWQEHQKKVKLFFFTFFRQHSPCSDYTDFLKIQFRLYLHSQTDLKIGVFGENPIHNVRIFGILV